MRKIILVALMCMGLVGCVPQRVSHLQSLVPPTQEEIANADCGPYPYNYKSLVEKHMGASIVQYYYPKPPEKEGVTFRNRTKDFGWGGLVFAKSSRKSSNIDVYVYVIKNSDVILMQKLDNQNIDIEKIYQQLSKFSVEFEYPRKVDSINAIYNNVKRLDQKDQYTKTEDHIKRSWEKIQTTLNDDGTWIFKIPIVNDYSNTPYDADKEVYTFHLNNRLLGSLSLFRYVNTSYFFELLDKTKKSKHTGVNAFGVAGEYIKIQGDTYGVYAKEVDQALYVNRYRFFVENISPSQARSLSKNEEAFIICKPRLGPNGTFTTISSSHKSPTLDSGLEMDISQNILNVEPVAILLCDKSTRKVLRIISKEQLFFLN